MKLVYVIHHVKVVILVLVLCVLVCQEVIFRSLFMNKQMFFFSVTIWIDWTKKLLNKCVVDTVGNAVNGKNVCLYDCLKLLAQILYELIKTIADLLDKFLKWDNLVIFVIS